MQYTSEGLFELASSFDIPLTAGSVRELSDDQFTGFSQAYRIWSERRDRELRAHIAATPTLFRVLIPHSPRIYGLAAQTAWYLDEIIIRDPTYRWVCEGEEGVAQRKLGLVTDLQLLNRVSEVIDGGLLLMYGAPLVGRLSAEPTADVLSVVRDPVVQNELAQAVRCAYGEAPASNGQLVGVYELALDGGGIVGFDLKGLTIPAGQQVTTPPIGIPTGLPPIALDELRRRVAVDPFKRAEGVFAKEAQRILAATEAARRASCAVLFDRPIDALFVRTAGTAVSEARQLATVGVLNAALPYVRDVDPSRLQQLRNRLPNAFRDFRAELHAIVASAMTGSDCDPAELAARINARVLPRIASLDAEMKAEARAARLTGYGTPVITSLATVLGATLTGGAAILPAMLALGGAAAVSVKAAAEYAKASAIAEANPFFFLWNAR